MACGFWPDRFGTEFWLPLPGFPLSTIGFILGTVAEKRRMTSTHVRRQAGLMKRGRLHQRRTHRGPAHPYWHPGKTAIKDEAGTYEPQKRACIERSTVLTPPGSGLRLLPGGKPRSGSTVRHRASIKPTLTAPTHIRARRSLCEAMIQSTLISKAIAILIEDNNRFNIRKLLQCGIDFRQDTCISANPWGVGRPAQAQGRYTWRGRCSLDAQSQGKVRASSRVRSRTIRGTGQDATELREVACAPLTECWTSQQELDGKGGNGKRWGNALDREDSRKIVQRIGELREVDLHRVSI